jgi:predicted nuclease of predicted toxin-antitoxin system
VKVFLDENFPLPLYHRLRATGVDVEHVIVLGQRGASDDEIRRRLLSEELLFLTNDVEFAELPEGSRAIVVVSRVRQNQPIRERVTLWFSKVQAILDSPRAIACLSCSTLATSYLGRFGRLADRPSDRARQGVLPILPLAVARGW